MGEGANPVTANETPDVTAIKADIEETRAEMSETIDEIEERLSPRHLAQQAKASIKDATARRVGAMMNSATGTARDLASEGREAAGGMMEHVKESPMPYVLIGLGVGWLILKGRGDTTTTTYNRPLRGRGYGSYDEHRYEEHRGDEQSWTESVSDVAARTRNRLGEYQSRALGSSDQWVRDNPLAFGVAALAVGAALGLSIPETDVEHEWMGETRDNLVEKAQELKDNAVETIQETIAGSNA
jgi:ElaB/YqjD/DUF883 family membrane-anchored ribosome-binding protein